MVDIPVELFLGFIGMGIAMAVFGFLRQPQIPAMLTFGGMFIMTISVVTTNVIMGYDITEADNTITPSQVDYMDVNIGTSVTKLSAGGVNNIFAGEEIVNTNSMLYSKRIDQVCMSLSKTGAPTGTVNIAVYDSVITPTQANYLYLLGTKDSTTLTTTQTSYCFIGIDTYVTTTNQAIGAFFNGGSAGNEVNVFSNATGNVYDGTNSIRTRYVASWSDFSTTDTRMSVSLTAINEDIVNTVEPNLYEFTQLPKVLFALLGVILMLSGGLMVIKT